MPPKCDVHFREERVLINLRTYPLVLVGEGEPLNSVLGRASVDGAHDPARFEEAHVVLKAVSHVAGKDRERHDVMSDYRPWHEQILAPAHVHIPRLQNRT